MGEYGRTPIWIATERGLCCTKIVKLFLGEKNADVNKAADTNGRTLICTVDDGTTPLYKVAQYGHTEIVKILAEKKADVNNPTNSGETPLQIAEEKGHSIIVSFLKKLRHKK